MINVKKTKLNNNLRIAVTPMKSTEAVSVFVMAKAGARYETKSNLGIAHFLEHMFFKGGDRYKTPRDVAEAVDGVGGKFNAFTSNETVGYYIKVAKENVELAFDVLSDMLLNSKFKQEDIEREQGVIVEEYNMYQDNPQSVMYDEFQRMMYQGHPLGEEILGDMKFVKSTTKKDFVDYKKKLYTASNMIVSVAGNITLAEVKKLTQKYLPLKKNTKKNVAIPYKFPKTSKKQVKVINKKTEQAHMAIGVPTFGGQDPLKYPADILSVILGGGMSSRLFTSVRERHGLAYYVNAQNVAYADAGNFVVTAGVNINKTELAIKLIMAELKEITLSPVPAKELKKAKQAIIGGMALHLESSDTVANGVATQELLFDKIETIAEIKRKYRAVTAEQVQKLAQRIFKDEKLVVSIIGPFKNDAPFRVAQL
ncbi:MAG: pitrilysin family protein [Patescibacteria group bacterium]|nr:pitrilysin family protein [Patescibacteria group bacterium]